MKNQLQKALALSKKTGDRLIVFDLGRDVDPFVVMDLAEYEKIIIGQSGVRGLTEDELLDKINRDIAIWRGEQDQDDQREEKAEKTEPFTPLGSIINRRREGFMPEAGWQENWNSGTGPEPAEFTGQMDGYADFGKREKNKRNPWRIPSERKQAAEEVIDEDFQYLEKI